MSREGSEPDEEQHREIDLLLPWYANGTLAQGEARKVERHLALCASCQRELEALEHVRAAVILSSEEVPAPSAEGLERVLARIEAEEQAKEVERTSWWEVLWDRVRSLALPPPLPAWRLVPVLAVLVIIVQSATLITMVGRGALAPGAYRTLSGPSDGLTSRNPRLIIVFHEGASAGAVRELLLRLDGNIIRGPTPEGAYTVEIGRSRTSPEELDRIVDELRAKPDLVRFVEKAY